MGPPAKKGGRGGDGGFLKVRKMYPRRHVLDRCLIFSIPNLGSRSGRSGVRDENEGFFGFFQKHNQGSMENVGE